MLAFSLHQKPRPAQGPRPAPYRPCLEALEDRCLLSFGTSGIVLTDFNTGALASDMALQPDGKIVAAGLGIHAGGGTDFALARYNGDGTLDPTFDGDGKLTTVFGNTPEDRAVGLALQPDGKIVAAGRDGEVVRGAWTQDFALARYNPNGSLDASFGGRKSTGKVTTDFSDFKALNSSDEAHDAVIQPDGKIVAAGGRYSGPALARYLPDGRLDLTFGNGGKVTTGPRYVVALTLHPATDPMSPGKIVVAGETFVARYNPNGTLDTAFGNNGTVIPPIQASQRHPVTSQPKTIAVAVQADGKIVVAGSSGTAFGLTRLNPDGSVDVSFGTAGVVTTSFGRAGDDGARAVFVQPDGKIVAAGWSVGTDQDFAVARYNPDGSLDTTFNPTRPLPGTAVTAIPGSSDDEGNAVVVQPDGKIVAAGSALVASRRAFALVRYYADGQLDDGSQDGAAPLMAAVAAPSSPASSDQADRAVTVMTRNLYLGADIFPVFDAVASGDPAAIIDAVSTGWQGVLSTNFFERAEALADEIADAQPLLIGLQEVSQFRTGAPDSFFGNPTQAEDVAFDYLEILLDELDERGLDYAAVSVTQNTDAELTGFVAPGDLRDIRLTDRDVILARTDLPGSALRLYNIQAANFATNLSIPIGDTGQFFTNLRGWNSVDATMRGKTFRFINTHLEVESTNPLVNTIQVAQANELLLGPADTSLPVLLVGDFNSKADGTGTATYELLIGAGFNDAWSDTHSGELGNTFGHDADLRNMTVNFTERIDLMLYRGDIRAFAADVVGEELLDRTPSGLWPSDHGGVIATFGVHVRPEADSPPVLQSADVQPLLAETLARWQAAGADISMLGAIDIRIADLGGATLGLASGNTIWLDDNAGGWGWYVDATPNDDSEFTTPGNQGEQGKMDLLTGLAHQIGHLLGQDHADDGVMAETLMAGTRRMPLASTDIDWLAAAHVLFSKKSRN